MRPGWHFLPVAFFVLTFLGAHHATAGTPHIPTGEIPSALDSQSADLTTVTIPAGMAVGGIALHPTTAPGEVEIAQYGEPEDLASFTNTGFQAVRFEPPFVPPFTITKVAFPSFTMNGVPAVFPSVRLCEGDPATGLPRIVTPLFLLAPYTGNSNGLNEVPVNVAVSDSGKVFWWCIEFPTKFIPQFSNDYPFIRTDSRDPERGYFGNSFEFTTAGRIKITSPPGNFIVSMFCQLASPDLVPIESSSNLGANRLESKVEFSFKRPGDRRADGTPMPSHSLRRTDLLYRVSLGPLKPWASAGPGQETIPVDILPPGPVVVWTTQAVDRYGHRAVSSDVIATAPLWDTNPIYSWDEEEPNGRMGQAALITPPIVAQLETVFPAGDQDFYSFYAKPGDVILAKAFEGFPFVGGARQELILLLYDKSGKAVALDDSSSVRGFARIDYVVPPRSPSSTSIAPLKFTLQVADIRGSLLSPDTAPVIFLVPNYRLTVLLNPPGLRMASAHTPSPVDADGFGFKNTGPNPVNPEARLLYVLPQSAAGAHVILRLYDVHGRLVRTLIDRGGEPGAHVAIWDGKDDGGRSVSSGMYYARLTAGAFRAEQKVSIVK